MIISVKQKHIRSGKRKMARSCPVAMALKDARILSPQVCYTLIYSRLKNGKLKAHRTSRRVKRFINAFDDGRKVKPFNFRLTDAKGRS